MSRPDPFSPIARDFYVTKAKTLSGTFAERQSMDNRTRSPTSCFIGLVPDYPLALALDITMEQKIDRTIMAVYPSIGQRRSTELGASVADHTDRARSWYRYNYLDLDRDHEAVWAVESTGAAHYACEVGERVDQQPASLWSVADLFVNLDSTLKLVHAFWAEIGYFGSGRLAVKLSVPQLTPFCNNTQYLPLFYETPLAIPLEAVRKLAGIYPVSEATAELVVDYDGRTSRRQETLVNAGNQLLRDLRFGVDTSLLRDCLAKL